MIGVENLENRTSASEPRTEDYPKNLLVTGVICIATLGVVAGSLLAAVVVYQIQKREENADAISNFSMPSSSQFEENDESKKCVKTTRVTMIAV